MPLLLDEPAVDIDAPPDAVWSALLDVGSVVAGVHVTEATPASTLRLAGRQVFQLSEATTLTAESRAVKHTLADVRRRTMAPAA